MSTGLPSTARKGMRYVFVAFGVVLALIGLVLAAGGLRLLTLGGSWYYAVVGLMLLASGAYTIRGRLAGAWMLAGATILTLLWSLWETGLSFWPLVPRLGGYVVLAMVMLLLLPQFPGMASARARTFARSGAILLALCFVAGAVAAFQPQGVIRADTNDIRQGAAIQDANTPRDQDWRHYGRSPAGTRHAPFTQIDKQNVGQLQLAWTYRTGDVPGRGAEDQNTPLQIGNTLYVCTVSNRVIALDADTGQERWAFDPKAHSPEWQRCRGVSYYEPAQANPVDQGGCSRRIVLNTIDARLIQLDASTGRPCASFGDNGTVDLTAGMGKVLPGWYFPTAAPTVVRDLIVVGGWVVDRHSEAPSGAVRAFNARTGELVWVWDVGASEDPVALASGEYSRGTPNVWSAPAFDDALGLLYVPTGNGKPNYWGADRSPATEKYSSSVVALDIETGKVRWHFQTVHHDLWDYDVPSQPALYDIPDGKGGVTPALIQLTKRGQIFLFDRRDGTPLQEIREVPVPQEGGQKGDWLSATQPYPIGGIPAIGAAPLTEARMWGVTMFDQLYCRIFFKSLRYEGDFTPPSTTPYLQWPGITGGQNWGSASVDTVNGYMYTNDIRYPQAAAMLAIEARDTAQAAPGNEGTRHSSVDGMNWITFRSPLGIPCQEPPYGTMTAIDLHDRTVLWQVPMGTVKDTGPRGYTTNLEIPLGMPTLAGAVNTASGLLFFAGTQDFFLRALDTATGKELWKHRLPVGGQGTPITYVSPETGCQYIALSAGGARNSRERGDYILAYRLRDCR